VNDSLDSGPKEALMAVTAKNIGDRLCDPKQYFFRIALVHWILRLLSSLRQVTAASVPGHWCGRWVWGGVTGDWGGGGHTGDRGGNFGGSHRVTGDRGMSENVRKMIGKMSENV
jgi:hypothetical protein